MGELNDVCAEVDQSEVAASLAHQAQRNLEVLAAAEPGDTAYQRDLTVSCNKLGELAAAEGLSGPTRDLLQSAADLLRTLHGREPHRLDLAEELRTALYFLGRVAESGERTKLRAEARRANAQFEAEGVLTNSGLAVMAWVDESW